MTHDLQYFRSSFNARIYTQKDSQDTSLFYNNQQYNFGNNSFHHRIAACVRHCALSFEKNEVNDIWMLNNISEKSHSQSQSAD